jgi:alkanesulfonate monooxygenase SsuD/methylene tetrahydromethanopterin reductase-like flavin-dependent oxidoreductase (luciferase family)
VTDAPNQPAPVQERLPLMIGGGGERRTMRIAAQYADEWNAWTSPDVLAHKVKVLGSHCDDLGREPAEIAVSTQALLFLSTDQSWLAKSREQPSALPTIVGTPAEVSDIIGHYRDSGADELIIPDFTMGSMSSRKDTCDLFMQEIAPHFR